MFDSPIVQNQKGYVWMEVKGKLKQESPSIHALYARYLQIVSTTYQSLQASHTD
jgi:hypothetical protein